jgi:hypothetical protein
MLVAFFLNSFRYRDDGHNQISTDCHQRTDAISADGEHCFRSDSGRSSRLQRLCVCEYGYYDDYYDRGSGQQTHCYGFQSGFHRPPD